MVELEKLFRQHFGDPSTHTVCVPGRLELLGNHTDYNDGLVLALAVDRSLSMAVARRYDGQVELVSSAFPQKEKFHAATLRRNESVPWADYVKGVLAELSRRQAHFTGFNAAIQGNIPLGAGLSSSAALTVATALAIRALHPFTLPVAGPAVAVQRSRRGSLPPLTRLEKVQLARLCQAAENNFVEVQCGLLDPLTILFGKAHHALEIDCQSLAVEPVPFYGEVAVVVCPSGISRSLAAGNYNDLRRHCAAAAKALGTPSLRAVDPTFLASHRKKLSEREYGCAYHVATENQRVLFGVRALHAGDFAQLGDYFYQSHASSRDFLRNSCPELDLLVALAREHPGCLGARLTGGGFGGATINLVQPDQVASFVAAIRRVYLKETGRKLTPLLCQAADGAA